MEYRREIDGLRALAVFAVLLFHRHGHDLYLGPRSRHGMGLGTML